MAVFNLRDLLASLGGDQRVIGIDPGARTIGLALSDVRRSLASPYGSHLMNSYCHAWSCTPAYLLRSLNLAGK